MIKIKLSALIDSINMFNYLVKMPFKVNTAYKIARITREISRELDLFNQAKDALAIKYGEMDENNNMLTDENGNYKIKKETEREFLREYQNLLNEEVQLNAELIPLK